MVNSNLSNSSLVASQPCLYESQRDIADSNDLCINEDVNGPGQIHSFSAHGKPAIPQPSTFDPQCSTSITPFCPMDSSGTKMRTSNERDLSHPKKEAYPPDGALKVPLLRHQRIALSWMMQKETNSLHCSGGILADDQGLGKTVSTIALILTERPTSAKTLKEEEGEPEMLDLEEDDKKMENTTTSSSVKYQIRPWSAKLERMDKNQRLEDDSVQLNRKRKHSSISDKRRSKKGGDNELVESVVHPLARVEWFRVVLDEAQTIKNHKTRVAQACCGLRAKRRWCLSGTPIQNAISDLYSYFKFLKYEPYSAYNSFCFMVKFQHNKNPTKGYQKLQAVLKNIMLRCTKGTLLDGQLIISLPPKSAKLKKVEFSMEERDIYNRLEADSRAQFQAYADSGTVQQNYANLLVMLLKLRQACDHPYLVQGYDFSSVLKSSIHTAEKIPQEKKIALLSCLEASLAICCICRDPAEDAVVSICSHIFCNQCISERFTCDANQCPAGNCKVELSASNVLSKGTLKSFLHDQVGLDSSYASHSDFPDRKELIGPRIPSRFESSKIKAVLEVLKSLSKPHSSLAMDVSKQPSVLDECDSGICGADNESYGATANSGSGKENIVVKEKAIVFSQ